MNVFGSIERRPGQLGIAGTSEEERITGVDVPVFYVNAAHPNANDLNDGTDPLYPLSTIQGIVTRTLQNALGTSTREPILKTYSTIFVSGTVNEDVVTGAYTLMPSYVSIIGVGHSRYSPSWIGSSQTVASLDLRCVGWKIKGFRFYGKTGAACIVLRHTDTGADDIAIRTVIEDCYFDGLTTGLTGIESHGCYDVWIVNNTFQLWQNAANTGIGMRVTTTPLAIPYRNHIVDNIFDDSDNGMIWPSNGSRFEGNKVNPVGYTYTMVQAFNTSLVANPGDKNIVVGNYFADDYSIAGGYRGGATDKWFGNFTPDIAEAEVGDNGVTFLPPA